MCVSKHCFHAQCHLPLARFPISMELRERREDLIRRHIRPARWRPRRWMARYLRFVFANEPVERLAGIRERIRLAWDI